MSFLDYIFNVRAVLDPSSLSLKSIQDQLNGENLKIKVGEISFDSTGIKDAKNNINSFNNAISQSATKAAQNVKKIGDAYAQLSRQDVYNALSSNILYKSGAEMSLPGKGLDSITQEQRVTDFERIRESFEKTFGKTNVEVKSISNIEGALQRFIITVRNAKDETLDFAYSLKPLQDNKKNIRAGQFQYQGGTFGESSIKETLNDLKEQEKQIEKNNQEYNRQKDYLASIQRTLNGIKASYSDRKNPLKGVESVDVGGQAILTYTNDATDATKEYVNSYHRLQAKINDYNDALERGVHLTNEQKRELSDLVSQVRLLGGNEKSQQTTATVNRSKDVALQVAAAREELQRFKMTVEESDVSSDKLEQELSELTQKLNEVGQSAAKFGEYSDALDVTKAKFQRLKTEINSIKSVEKQLSSLESFSNRGILGKSTNESSVQSLNKDVSDLRLTWEQLKREIDSTDDETALEALRGRVLEIGQAIQDTSARAMKLRDSLTNVTNSAKLESDKSIFGNRMETWLQKNTNLGEALRLKVKELQSQLESADNVKFAQIKKEFQDIRAYAEATNQTGLRFLDTVKEKLGKFTGWFSMSQVIMGLTNEMKQSVETLHDVDDILTEISKTSDMTESQLAKLGRTAFDSASDYGKNVQDYLTGVQEMSRAGYKNAEQMSKTSILAQSAGDMTADVANDYLIATDAAYKLNGNITQLSKILDGQNQIKIIVPLYRNV